jgi:hypothetical protein
MSKFPVSFIIARGEKCIKYLSNTFIFASFDQLKKSLLCTALFVMLYISVVSIACNIKHGIK